VLPVLNEQVVAYAARAATALHGEIQTESRFDRKNYFYPDLPKNYQITQHGQPLSLGGYLEVVVEKPPGRSG
jgi:aspartyl-tRNA(Asn)/glutamyl-tRNA(Gln) amidotransferase subunit B